MVVNQSQSGVLSESSVLNSLRGNCLIVKSNRCQSVIIGIGRDRRYTPFFPTLNGVGITNNLQKDLLAQSRLLGIVSHSVPSYSDGNAAKEQGNKKSERFCDIKWLSSYSDEFYEVLFPCYIGAMGTFCHQYNTIYTINQYLLVISFCSLFFSAF